MLLSVWFLAKNKRMVYPLFELGPLEGRDIPSYPAERTCIISELLLQERASGKLSWNGHSYSGIPYP